jgi:hypothetical protein
MTIKRDVNNDVLSIIGGTGAMPYGANLQLYGGGNVAQSGGAIFAVGDAAGTGTKVGWSMLGTTDNPELSMNNNKIVSLKDPTNAQDAMTLNYFTTHGAGTMINNSYYMRDTSLPLTGEEVRRDVDNSYLAMYGGNAIAGGTGIIVAYGKNHPGTNEAEVIAGDAAGVGNIVVSGWRGGNTPLMDMNGYNITGIRTIVNSTDAVNKSYADSLVANVSAGGSGGQIIYFNHSASPDVAGFETLNLIPSGNAEADESVVVNSGLGEVVVDSYVTSLLYPAITTIPPGLWRFRTFHYVSNSGGNTNTVFKVYKRSAAGAETLLFSVVSEDIDALDVREYLTSYAQASAIPLLTTDRLEIKVYGQSTSVSDKTFHFVYDGNIHTSHVLTPISVLSSLDNYAYLPGRPDGQTLTGSTTSAGKLYLNGSSSNNGDVVININGGNITTSPYSLIASGIDFGSPLVANNGYIRLYNATDGRMTLQTGSTYSIALEPLGGKVSIGSMLLPDTTLHVFGDMKIRSGDVQYFGTNSEYIGGTTTGNHIRIIETGNVGINTASPSEKLDLASGNLRVRTCSGTPTFSATGVMTCASDEKLKKDITPFTPSLKEITGITPIKWSWNINSKYPTTDTQSGFSAQNIQTNIPDAVIARDDFITKYKEINGKLEPYEEKTGTQTLSIDQTVILATAINSIKEQQTLIEAQQKEIDELKVRLDKAGIK